MIKTLAKSIREYKKASILAPAIIACEVILECCIPFVATLLINQINVADTATIDMSVVVRYGLILVGLAFASLCCGALAGHFAAIASCGFAKNLRHDVYEKIQGLDVGEFTAVGNAYRNYSCLEGVGIASDCTGCEACMKECPQQIDIASLMPEVAKTFETEVYGFTNE